MINQSYAMDEKKTRRFGKFFNTIDFTVTNALSKETVDRLKADTTIGTLQIGSKNFDLTLSEIEHLENTLRQAKNIFQMKYRMGHYGK